MYVYITYINIICLERVVLNYYTLVEIFTSPFFIEELPGSFFSLLKIKIPQKAKPFVFCGILDLNFIGRKLNVEGGDILGVWVT
jgi:hypothetical protein